MIKSYPHQPIAIGAIGATAPVEVSRDQDDVFEHMHYVCFHYEFEHDPGDPDEECTRLAEDAGITLLVS